MMRLDHLAGGARVLSFRLAVQIAGADRRHVQQPRKRDQSHQQRMAHGRRRQRRRLEQSFFKA
jgi:hypothetical protein